jgi:Tol biopolymer transport system component
MTPWKGRETLRRTIVGLVLGSVVVAVIGGVSANDWRNGREEFGPWSAPVSLGPIVNSASDDAKPAVSNDGLSLYFHSPRAEGPFIYVSHRKAIDLPWEAPVKLGPAINSGPVDAGPTLTADGHYLFFGRFVGPPFDLDIYVSHRSDTRDDLSWEEPVALPSPVNEPSFDVPTDFFENPRGKPQLFFLSDRLTGLGLPGFDIFMTELGRHGTWSDPAPVTELNSDAQDDAPTVRADGLEIIFSSWREGATSDLYVARRDHLWEPWSTPEKLGPTVNSPDNDIQPALSANGTTLYFASTRPGGVGGFDLWVCTRERRRHHKRD